MGPAPLLFRLVYSVRDLRLTPPRDRGPAYPLVFDYDGSHGIVVLIRPPSDEEQQQGHAWDTGICEATSRVEPNPHVYAMFEQLAQGELPERSTPGEHARYLDGEGRIKQNHAVPLEILPEPFRSFANQVTGELTDYLTRTVKVLRWRHAHEGPHSPFAHLGVSWSFDGSSWRYLPMTMIARGWETASLTVGDAERDWVRQIVLEKGDEPFSHELHREAWLQRHANPRSALLLAVAAAEIGFKEYVGALVPDARWLVQEIPAPPLVRMLIDYLPQLPARLRIQGEVKLPPQAVLDQLRKGVTLRNVLAHRGSVPISAETIQELLVAVEDLLWLLGYYRGWDWAIEHLSEESRSALGLEGGSRTNLTACGRPEASAQ